MEINREILLKIAHLARLNFSSESEKEMIRQLGLKLIGDPPVIEDLIQIMIKYVNQNIPSDELFKAIQKYHN